MFRGSFEHTLDAKGRLSLPSKFRDVIAGKNDNRLIITNFITGGARCLEVYPLQEWQDLEDKLRRKDRFTPDINEFEHYYFGRAHECTVDNQWRLLIPPTLRRYAGLQRKSFVSGISKRGTRSSLTLNKNSRKTPSRSAIWGCERLTAERMVAAMKGERAMLPRKPIQDISVIDVAGDIDFREMIRIKDTIGSLIEKERIKVVLNLKSVDHINYLSIGVLIERLKLLRHLNGDLKLAGMGPFLRDIFKVVGMDRVFEEYTSLEDAIESFDDDWEGDGTSH
jgi:MraZ protein